MDNPATNTLAETLVGTYRCFSRGWVPKAWKHSFHQLLLICPEKWLIPIPLHMSVCEQDPGSDTLLNPWHNHSPRHPHLCNISESKGPRTRWLPQRRFKSHLLGSPLTGGLSHLRPPPSACLQLLPLRCLPQDLCGGPGYGRCSPLYSQNPLNALDRLPYFYMLSLSLIPDLLPQRRCLFAPIFPHHLA